MLFQYDRSGSFMDFREVSKRFLLPAGRYCVIPSTFKEDQPGDFLLRVLESREWASLQTEKATVAQPKEAGAQEGDVVEVEEETITVTLTRKRLKGVKDLKQLYNWDLGELSEEELLLQMFAQLQMDK